VPLPEPVPGLVIRYSYLWRSEHLKGREEGAKDRPCAVVLVTTAENDDRIVTVLPITHAPPIEPGTAIELPSQTKQRLGLDAERSRIMLTEANRFAWPGPDLRPSVPGDPASVSYGLLPRALYMQVAQAFVAAIRARRARVVGRTE
jgi:hypothetical protein